jgi:Rieske Fe-S protein
MEAALYWDTPWPYHYIRLQDNLLIVGGEDHKTGQEDDGLDRFARLEDWTRERFPIGPVQYRWSGQVMEPVDGMAFIGRNPGDADNVFIATGDSGQGMTHGTIAGMLISDLIAGRANPWEKLYDPSRKPLRSIADFLSENLNAVKYFAEYVTPGEVASENEIAPGEGALIRHGLDKLAVYRDKEGGVHRLSAACTHLKCFVHWNSLEKTWDCPCHGSRFSVTGEVLNGPAIAGLQPAEKKAA